MKFLSAVFCILLIFNLIAQQQVEFKLDLEEPISKGNPVSIDISSLGINPNDTAYQLYMIKNDLKVPLPSQIDVNGYPTLSFIAETHIKQNLNNEFILEEINWPESEYSINLIKGKEGIRLVYKDKPLLNYQTAIVYPPDGVDPVFRKSGFIHPLWSPSGEILTRIQPPDHYHHYGLWGPWAHTHINGRFVDFCNLGEGLATVRFSGLLNEEEGPVYSRFIALQEHVDFGYKGEDQVALNEFLTVQVWHVDPEGKSWMVDYTTTINSPLDSGLILDAYRYGGGIGMRFTEKWHKDNCTVLTSEGDDRLTADGTKAKWCIIEGESNYGRSGILIMSHPTNRAHPEPMRVWPINANGGRGDMFFEFCPIRHDSWIIKRGKSYTLKYRMVVFDGQITVEEAENYWKAFAYPPRLFKAK